MLLSRSICARGIWIWKFKWQLVDQFLIARPRLRFFVQGSEQIPSLILRTLISFNKFFLHCLKFCKRYLYFVLFFFAANACLYAIQISICFNIFRMSQSRTGGTTEYKPTTWAIQSCSYFVLIWFHNKDINYNFFIQKFVKIIGKVIKSFLSKFGY